MLHSHIEAKTSKYQSGCTMLNINLADCFVIIVVFKKGIFWEKTSPEVATMTLYFDQNYF